MQSGFYSAAGGMVTSFNIVDKVSNNLANINTNGFKKDGVVIGDFQRLLYETRDELPIPNHTKPGAQFLDRVITKVPRVVEDYTMFELGGMQNTGNILDIALNNKNSFFQVDVNGKKMLTRDGSFSINNERKIVTKEGFALLGNNNEPIYINDGANLKINEDGSVYLGNNLINKISIGRVNSLEHLTKVGNNFFDNPASNPLVPETMTNVVQSGFIEKSNVNAVSEMIDLIEVNRMVGMYQKVMDAQMNDMNNEAIGKLALSKA